MYINGKETSHYTEKDFEEYRKKYIANIFQSFNLINSYTVYQNVELVLLLNGYKRKQIKKKVLDIIDKVGLTKFKNTKVSKLSGGQKQRVASARAIITNPELVLADEPTGALDSKSAKQLLESFEALNQKLNATILMVTHDSFTASYANRILFIKDGKIFNELTKGNDTRKQFFEKIIEVQTLLGGELGDVI